MMLNIFEEQTYRDFMRDINLSIKKAEEKGDNKNFKYHSDIKQFYMAHNIIRNHSQYKEDYINRNALDLARLYNYFKIKFDEEFQRELCRGSLTFKEFKDVRQKKSPRPKGYKLRDGELSHKQLYNSYRDLYMTRNINKHDYDMFRLKYLSIN